MLRTAQRKKRQAMTKKLSNNNNKTIDTLREDILNLFNEKDHHPDPENIEDLLTGIKESLLRTFASSEERNQKPHLRMSNLGYPDRRLWYEMNVGSPAPSPKLMIIFMFGHLLEELFLFLCREAGHKVEHEQYEVEIEGIKGHIDAIIDDVLVDVKTASMWNYKKFTSGEITINDPLGYVQQLSNYNHHFKKKRMGWIPINKASFHEFDFIELHPSETKPVVERIRYVKEMIKKPAPPEQKCFLPEPMGRGGNMKLAKGCQYCPFQKKCWSDANDGKGLRYFQYSNDAVALTHVEKTPSVEEIFFDNGEEGE